MKLVIAGNYSQYQEWLRDNHETPNTARYIDCKEKLMGLRDCEVVRAGEYWLNPVHRLDVELQIRGMYTR